MTRQGLAVAIFAEGVQPQVYDLRRSGQIAALIDYLWGCSQVIVHDLTITALAISKDPDELRAVPWWDLCIVERAMHLGSMAKWPRDPGRQETITALFEAYQVGVPILGLPEVINPDLSHALFAGGPISPAVGRHLQALAEGLYRTATAQFQAVIPELWNHLIAVEMPAAVEHVVMTVNGVLLDPKLCLRLDEQIPTLLHTLATRLATSDPGPVGYQGLAHPERTDAIPPWLARNELQEVLSRNRNGTYEVDDDTLKFLERTFPPAGWLRDYRKLEDLQGRPWLRGAMTSADGRVHPLHLPLHAATGRSATVSPEIGGIPKWCRPLVCATAGSGILELDYVGCEILVAACLHHERWLKEVYRSGDAISLLASELFPVETAGMTLAYINEKMDSLRGTSKSVIYGIFYGRLATSLAKGLRIPEYRAKILLNTILSRCPNLRRGMQASVADANVTGTIPIAFGLVRHLLAEEWAEAWKVRTLGMNTPVQGVAGIVFRRAMPLVAQAIRPFGGKILLPNHDAFVLEGPLGDPYVRADGSAGFLTLDAIADAGKQAMIRASLEVFPDLDPFVDVQNSHPSCWNKKGKANSIQDFIAACMKP